MALCGRPETWQAVCSTEQSSTVDTFANHLDTVETHLLQEIAARSAHFFEAAGVVQDLRSVLTRTFHQVSGLRKEVCVSLPVYETGPCTVSSVTVTQLYMLQRISSQLGSSLLSSVDH